MMANDEKDEEISDKYRKRSKSLTNCINLSKSPTERINDSDTKYSGLSSINWANIDSSKINDTYKSTNMFQDMDALSNNDYNISDIEKISTPRDIQTNEQDIIKINDSEEDKNKENSSSPENRIDFTARFL